MAGQKAWIGQSFFALGDTSLEKKGRGNTTARYIFAAREANDQEFARRGAALADKSLAPNVGISR